MAKKSDTESAVGYGNPPKRTRFKPGQSGNPKGRPRKSRTLYDAFAAELCRMITVTEDGKPKRMTKGEAIAKQHVHKAMKGSSRSTKLVLNCIEHDQSDQPDKLETLVEELRQRNRCLRANSVAQEEDTSIGRAHHVSSTDEEDEKS